MRLQYTRTYITFYLSREYLGTIQLFWNLNSTSHAPRPLKQRSLGHPHVTYFCIMPSLPIARVTVSATYLVKVGRYICISYHPAKAPKRLFHKGGGPKDVTQPALDNPTLLTLRHHHHHWTDKQKLREGVNQQSPRTKNKTQDIRNGTSKQVSTDVQVRKKLACPS